MSYTQINKGFVSYVKSRAMALGGILIARQNVIAYTRIACLLLTSEGDTFGTN